MTGNYQAVGASAGFTNKKEATFERDPIYRVSSSRADSRVLVLGRFAAQPPLRRGANENR